MLRYVAQVNEVQRGKNLKIFLGRTDIIHEQNSGFNGNIAIESLDLGNRE